jgi:hypothetical protein
MNSRFDETADGGEGGLPIGWFLDPKEADGRIENGSDPLAVHDLFLGKGLDLLTSRIERSSDHLLLKRLRAGNATIKVTYNGAAIIRNGQPKDPAEKEMAVRLLIPDRLRLTMPLGSNALFNGMFCQNGFMGLDNRDILPPFMPVLNNEEAVFGMILERCPELGGSLRMPWRSFRENSRIRSYPSDLFTRVGVTMYDILCHCLAAYAPSHGKHDAPTAVRSVGRYLQQIGSLPLPDFENHLRGLLRRYLCLTPLIMGFDAKNYKGDSYTKQNLVVKIWEPLQKDMNREDYIVPFELTRGRSLEQARQLSKKLVFQYGALLDHWPDIISTAKALRRKNRRIAKTT